MIGFDASLNGDLTAYKGAWIYKTLDVKEHSLIYNAVYEGYHYHADSIEKLIETIDNVSSDSTNNIFKLNEADEKIVLDTDEEADTQWVVVYQLSVPDVDDSFENDESLVEVTLSANNFNEASKYADQYLRMKQSDGKTSERWNDAEIVSINQL